NAIFRPGLISPPPPPLACSCVAAGVAADSLSVLSFVEPHAATTSALAAASTARPRVPIDVDMSLLTGIRWWWGLGVRRRCVLVAAPQRSERQRSDREPRAAAGCP